MVNIPKLKVRTKKEKVLAPCAGEMATLVACWASSSIDDKRCVETAKNLVFCIQQAKAPVKEPSMLNYHLARLGKQVLGKR